MATGFPKDNDDCHRSNRDAGVLKACHWKIPRFPHNSGNGC